MRVAVVGAGIAGRLVAHELALASHQVTVFERGTGASQACSFAAAGMLAPYSESAQCSAKISQLGVDALPWWRAFAAQYNLFFSDFGTLVLAPGSASAELEHFAKRIQLNSSKPPMGACDGADLRSLEPSLPDAFTRGLHIEGEAHVDPREVLDALWRELGKHAELRTNSECHLSPGIVTTSGESHAFDWVVDARGLGARADTTLALRAVRGELIHLHAPNVRLKHAIRFLHPRHPIYIVPRADGRFVVGATSIESEDYSPISVQSAHELMATACAVHPGFAEARIVETVSHCRPAMPDHEPIVQQEERTIRINGLYRHGYMAGPALAERVLAIVSKSAGAK